MKYLVISIFYLTISSCAAQSSQEIRLNKTDYEIITIFINQMFPENFNLLSEVSGDNVIKRFIGKYQDHLKVYKNSDSICRNSKDIEKLKISCPIADSFQMYENLLSDEDISYFHGTYSHAQEFEKLNINRIFDKSSMLVVEGNYPSLEILNIYYNRKGDLGIIAYRKNYNKNESESNFYILKKMKNIWWKPLGSFKL
ncbi:hypothetical protein [Maribacter sp. LLG6340-A2]|uniref:hypothetical protein n=1 Tax=Maribacter sp. LLG6340-A2 TaxID=3160834 RepID=UPI003869C3D7